MFVPYRSFPFGNLVNWNNNRGAEEFLSIPASKRFNCNNSDIINCVLHITFVLDMPVRLYYVWRKKHNLFWILTSYIYDWIPRTNWLKFYHLSETWTRDEFPWKTFPVFLCTQEKYKLRSVLHFWNSPSSLLIHKTIHHIALTF